MMEAVVRQVCATAGTALTTYGIADANTAQTVAGALAVIIMFAWSLYDKKGRV